MGNPEGKTKETSHCERSCTDIKEIVEPTMSVWPLVSETAAGSGKTGPGSLLP